MKSKNQLYLSIVVVLVVTFTPGNGKIAGNYLDKIVHFTIFFFLAYAILQYYVKATEQIEYLLWAMIGGIGTEILQQFIPGRNMDVYDVLADNLGVVCDYYFWYKD